MDPIDKLIFILGGLPTTLAISILSFLLGFIIGLPLAFIRAYTSKPFQLLVDGYEKVLRGVPEIVTMLFLYFGVGGIDMPACKIFKNAFFAATFALGLRSGAHQSQVFRGAIRGIGLEQMVTARSLGLSRLQAIIYVMIPQTFIIATPGLGSEYALLVKDSAYAFIIGVIEMMRRADSLRKIPPVDMIFPYFAAAFLYILLTFPLATYLDMWGSRKKEQLGL